MRRSFLLALLCVFGLTAVALPLAQPQSEAVAQEAITYLGTSELSEGNNGKYPELAPGNGTVHAGFNTGSTTNSDAARYWRKPEGETSWGGPRFRFGDAEGFRDYRTVDVATAWHDLNYVVGVWLESANVIKLRVSTNGGESWSDSRTVVSGGNARFYPKVGVVSLSDGTEQRIVVAWSQDKRFRYSVCNPDGTGCTDDDVLGPGSGDSRDAPSLAGGPDGSLIAAMATASGNIWARFWNRTANGNRGDWSGAELVADEGAFLAQPTGAIDANRVSYVAYRIPGGGVIYRQRNNTDGNWNARSSISGVDPFGTTSVSADRNGDLHFFWVRSTGSTFQAYYAKRIGSSGEFLGPRIISNPNFIANGIGVATSSDFTYGHGIAESFTGSTSRARYWLFRTTGGCQPTITITGSGTVLGLPVVRTSSVIGTLTSPAGCNPTANRVALNAPDPAKAVETGGLAFAIPMDAPQQCRQTLYAQLRTGTSNYGPWVATQFIADPDDGSGGRADVDATVRAMNPNVAGAGPAVAPLAEEVEPQAVDVLGQGASNGDPAFTRSQQYQLNVWDAGDCTGIVSGISANDARTFTAAQMAAGIDANIPLFNATGVQQIDITLTDAVGNSGTYRRAIIRDITPPVLDTNQTQVLSDTQSTGSILQHLTVSQIAVSDDLFFRGISLPENEYTNLQRPAGQDNGAEFWGLWIAVEYLGKINPNQADSVAPPNASAPELLWAPVMVADAAQGFRVPVNLFSGTLDRSVTPAKGGGFSLLRDKDGVYRVYMRALDGAGNVSEAAEWTTFTLAPGYSLIQQTLPLVAR